ncbi:MAG: hypothetical protein HRU11_10300 [Parvularculaceae bacterium]|nr:hypothetical protein [Parvularculaceae bacterium]
MRKLVLSCCAAAMSLAGANALAAVEIDVTEVAGDVVFDISGSLIISDARVSAASTYSPGIITGGENWYIGTGDGENIDRYFLSSADGAFGTSIDFNETYSPSTGSRFFI